MLGRLELAGQVVATVEVIGSDESKLLFRLIAMQAKVQRR